MQLIRKLTAKFLQLLIDLEKYRLHAFLFIYFSGVCVYYFLFDVYWLSCFNNTQRLCLWLTANSSELSHHDLLYIVGFFCNNVFSGFSYLCRASKTIFKHYQENIFNSSELELVIKKYAWLYKIYLFLRVCKGCKISFFIPIEDRLFFIN